MRGKDVQRGGTVREWAGEAAGPPPPADAERVSFTVRDAQGMSCDTALWILRALHRLDASVWVEHRKAGSLQIAERGRGTPGQRMLWTNFYVGTELTIAATGPDARKALEACREMVNVPPGERKALYRESYSRKTKPKAEACKVCVHPDVELIDAALEGGCSPRSIRTDHPGVSRVEITAHRDGCMSEEEG